MTKTADTRPAHPVTTFPSLTAGEKLRIKADILSISEKKPSAFENIKDKIRKGKIDLRKAVYFSDKTKIGASKSDVGVTKIDGVEYFYKIVTKAVYLKFKNLEEIDVGVKIVSYEETSKRLIMAKGIPLDEIPFAEIPKNAKIQLLAIKEELI